MRAALKKQTENFIQVIEKAHKVLGEAIDACNLQTALQLLEECQEGAISLGTALEESEGEGFVAVSSLEEYCELVYQTYEALSQNQFVEAKEVCQNLDDVITRVWDSIKDIPIRKEVVFLPYKASMWDSLESVWKAADADPECDAYVIPVPYYDKNPDGSFKEMHYEGDLYPDYVPITDYNSYDFQSRRPDMIFIHNPYDGSNYVTSVHPFFYSSNLKNFTDKLVYIPYFVLGDIDPENEAAVKGMEHFVTVPGVIHAHKVIVQSENMRQVYINVMSRVAGENTRSYWEEKISGLGSPKFDKVHNTQKESVKVPEEWLKIIQKPDGSRKKIIFYNTSVSALLQKGEQMLVKMKDVFRIFEENKEEVALLWRPHPLIKATIESMRPQLWEEYRQIVELYKEEGWGIYDDTADMDRAIALCDGYYGDGSSVVQLCQEAGKPVMLQNVEIG